MSVSVPDSQGAAGAAPDARRDAARAFALAALGLADAHFAPASADASFRRYFRVEAEGRSWIVMDAPPEQENCEPFIRIADLMQDAGVHVPQVLAQDLARGYLLLSDLGRQTLLQVIDADNADEFFTDAFEPLLRLDRKSVV